MKITFISNYLTLHQIPFCEAMYEALGKNFHFVNTIPMEVERISMGWGNIIKYPFEMDLQQTGNLIDESDIVLIGSADDGLIQYRLSHNKPVIRYSERILKEGRWHMLSPRAIKNMLKLHTRFKNNRIWMLCASAYAAGDYNLFGSYWGKSYKWGYFPRTLFYEKKELRERKENPVSHILWCGRMLGWKHPELSVIVAKHLHEKRIPFHMDIIGDGEVKLDIQKKIKEYRLEEKVTLHGFVVPNKVREYMEKANIFLFTSDFHEGWGAVLNEAMNSGCACVASHAIGAAPYLIQDKVNGFLYRNGDLKQLCGCVEQLIVDRALCWRIGLNAYRTIVNNWNADVAAERFLRFCEAIVKEEKLPEYPDGPMSKAKFISNNWYHEERRRR